MLFRSANTLIDVLIENGEREKARKLLGRRRPLLPGRDAVDSAILARRVRAERQAHWYFERAGEAVNSDPRALLEFAQAKLWLAEEARKRHQRDSRRRFLTEARALLERVIQLDTSPTRHAWAWRELARTLNWLKAPVADVKDAYCRAIALLPDERRFAQELARILTARR